MNEKEFIKFLKEKEWKKFLTRPYNFSFVSIHAQAYHHELRHIIGADCLTLYVAKYGQVSIYRDTESTEKIKNNFDKLILNKAELLKIIEKIFQHRHLLDKIDATYFKDLRQRAKFFAHLTALPFNIGNAIVESRLHERSAGYQKILSTLQEVRCLNYYHKFGDSCGQPQKDDFVYLVIGQKAFFTFNQPLIKRAYSHLNVANCATKGQVAFSGKAVGRARIIFSKNDAIKLERGDILVSNSTNPELLPVMKLSAAIVTDEGGMMSHAAILSRELKIPCVVGTGCATKVFQDGDLVEVDAVEGLVKKI